MKKLLIKIIKHFWFNYHLFVTGYHRFPWPATYFKWNLHLVSKYICLLPTQRRNMEGNCNFDWTSKKGEKYFYNTYCKSTLNQFYETHFRMLFVIICPFINASWGLKTSKELYGQLMRWNIIVEGLKEEAAGVMQGMKEGKNHNEL